MSQARISLAVMGVLVAVCAGWLFWPAPVPVREGVSGVPAPAEQVARGAYLARAGNCLACHTVPGDAPYAGGRAIETPFGAVFSSNLTPDKGTGIGSWTQDDFWRAMHEGRSADGRLLSPAFPYPSYTRVTREDSDALLAYLRSLPSVARADTPDTLRFPYNTQAALRVWRALYFRQGNVEADPQRSAEWNRGAYLVEGLGHCAACHTPRDALGGPIADAAFAGGAIPMMGWDAPPLAEAEPIDDVRADEWVALLSSGTSASGVTTGPMAEVVFHSLQHLAKADIEAMVMYLRSLPFRGAPRSATALPVSTASRHRLMAAGETLYGMHCAECHGDDGEGHINRYPPLAGNRLLIGDSPRNAINAVLYGGFAPSTTTHPQPYGMPSYAHRLSDFEIAAVLSYVRGAWGNDAAPVSPVEVGNH
jgi:mono/diheme cytochrome c family protein